MSPSSRFAEALKQGSRPMCDDCVRDVAGWPTRQSAHAAGTCLAAEGLIIRTRGQCAHCGKHKIVSEFVGTPPMVAQAIALGPTPLSKDRVWHWEGNIQSVLATYLVNEGYHLRQVVDTASKAPGVDIVAERDFQTLWVTVKGYPAGTVRTNASTQSLHWFSHAMFDVARYRTKREDIDIGVGLPDGFTSYLNLAPKVAWLKQTTPFRFFWVAEDGTVREE